MSTYLNTYTWDFSVTGNFQAIYGALDSHLQTFGWVLTADTGQTDPAGASAPAINSFAGYRVYKTGDALTAIYMRIDYGRGSAAGPRIKVQVGYTTDGAGTITGQKCTQLDLNPAAPGSTRQLALAGGNNWATVTLANDTSVTNVTWFSVERELDSTGTPVSTGFNIFASTASTVWQQYVPSSGTIPPQGSNQFTTALPTLGTSAAIGSNVLVGLVIPIKETGGGYPTLAMAVYASADFTANAATSFSVYGSSHTFLCMATNVALDGSANYHPMVRYE